MASRQLPFGSAKLRDLEVINRETVMKKADAASVSALWSAPRCSLSPRVATATQCQICRGVPFSH